MSEPFRGEIRIFSLNFAPRSWAFCNGQLLPINQNQALFSLLGTTYGGDGRVNFALPDLRGRVPIHRNFSHLQGERGGAETHALTVAQMPSHSHGLQATADLGTASWPDGSALARRRPRREGPVYSPPQSLVPMHPEAVGSTGAGQPHVNMQPYLTLHFCIALEGIFPSPN
jgi:microcystin-dependent protein